MVAQTTNVDIGSRLREERERLTFSQALFAARVGINRMSQVNYESGKRAPDTVYLRAAYEAGVDVGYVITGKRTGAPDFFRIAAKLVLEGIERRTGIPEDVLGFVIEALADAASAAWMEDQHIPSETPYKIEEYVLLSDVHELQRALDLNARLLRDIFGALNATLHATPVANLNGERRLALVLMLFRAFRGSGEVDPDVIRDALRVVAP